MARKDRTRFVARAAELALLDQLLVDDPPVNVVLVHGPGGIGKSTLLREFARRGQAAGWQTLTIEGRELPPLPDALDEAVEPLRSAERALLLVDSYEHMAALGHHLRRVVLPTFPERAVVVIAGRRPPDPGWLQGGWETITRPVELTPLSHEESLALLAAHGLTDRSRADGLAAWAAGSPLALALLARAGGDARVPVAGDEPREVVRTLVARLVEDELDGPRRDVLWVASIARVTTSRLLRDVLPDVDAVETLRWLSGRSFSEPLADGVTLHDLVRRALRADLRQRDPERERDLRRRITDSVHAAAVAGRLLLTIDLAELLETPELRSLYGWEGAGRNRLDRVRPGDAEQVATRLHAMGADEWWDPTRVLFEHAPNVVTIARDAAGVLCGYGISVTPASAPPAARVDPVLAPWLAHAAELAPDGNALLCRDLIDFTGDPASRIQAMLNVSAVLRSGLANPRYVYLPIDQRRSDVVTVSRILGARHLPELDADPERVQCHLLDAGPGGVLGLQRDILYLELGLPAPGHGAATAHDASRRQPDPAVDLEVVRDALRNLQVPVALADSPLARGHGVEARAASLRRLLEVAIEHTFGETDDERLLHEVLRRGYVEPNASHEQTARELNLSRAAYFRRLRRASERVAAYLARRSTATDR